MTIVETGTLPSLELNKILENVCPKCGGSLTPYKDDLCNGKLCDNEKVVFVGCVNLLVD